MHHLFCSGYLVTNTCITYQPRTITRASQDQIKLGKNNTVAISKWPQGAWSLPTTLAQHHEYTTTRYPRYHRDPFGDHNHDQHLVPNRDPYGDHNQLISLIKLFLLLLTHGVPYFRTGPLSTGAAIDRLNIHSTEVAHWTHTTEPMASPSHSCGPTAFRQNHPTAMTLSRPIRLTPL